MSYILQALARSEQERNQNQSPDLDKIFDNTEIKNHKPIKKNLVIIILALNVLVLGVIFTRYQFWSPNHSDSITPTLQQQTAHIDQSTKNAGLQTENHSMTYSLTRSEQPMPLANIDSGAFQMMQPNQTQKKRNSRLNLDEDSKLVVPESNTQENLQTSLTEKEGNKKSDYENIERIRSLPNLKINIHVYSDKIADRFVFINGKKYHQGDQLEGDSTEISEITRDGIIINQDGKSRHVQLER